MKTEIKEITPQWASEKLAELEQRQNKGEFVQRPPRARAIQRYTQDMKAGKWLLTHQGIAFSKAGDLLDGQNRLWAVVKSGCTVRMLVTTEVPGNGTLTAMDVIDGGMTRSVGESLKVSHGMSYAQELAVCAMQIINFTIAATPNVKKQSVQVSVSQALFVLNELTSANT